MKTSTVKARKPVVAHKSRRSKPLRSGDLEVKVTKSFASQVAAFIKRYRPALEALAKR